MNQKQDCNICNGSADTIFGRREIWRNGLWRLTMHSLSALNGFSYLEPIRHIPYIEELDGQEAATFGTTLALVSRALKHISDAKLIYVYVHGGTIPHLHVHLAPHKPGDFYCSEIIHGDLPEDRMSAEQFDAHRDQFRKYCGR